ncbi:MAG: ACT domain-containing protein, partial [Alphaproteobacteria bacterium]|nr:ACT domain-containing protein [Alphaproteobacteria bacterium]
GYKIKLLGIAEDGENGIFQRVHPVMVPANRPIAGVEGVYNAVVTEGDFVGTTVLEGRGAGAGPTASAVISDVIDIVCGRVGPVFGAPADMLTDKPTMDMDHHSGSYYIRLQVLDQPGVMAEVTDILRSENVSIEGILQRGRAPGSEVSVVMTIHETSEASVSNALSKMKALANVVKEPCMIRVEKFAEK